MNYIIGILLACLWVSAARAGSRERKDRRAYAKYALANLNDLRAREAAHNARCEAIMQAARDARRKAA